MQDFDIISLRSLPEARRRDLLTRFDREIYRPAFPDGNQREDVGIWLDLLHKNDPAPAPYLTVLLAVNGLGYVGGGLALEYYRQSQCALATYVAVSPRYRKAGLARSLLARGLEVLSWCEGHKPIPLFAEMDDPAKMPAEKHEASVRRAHILDAMGLLKCDLPYVQPALSEGGGRLDHMLFCAHRESLRNNQVAAGRLAAFLHEFYRSLGVAEPETDKDFCTMKTWLDQRESVSFTPLIPLPQEGHK